jgi:hypothetical protein
VRPHVYHYDKWAERREQAWRIIEGPTPRGTLWRVLAIPFALVGSLGLIVWLFAVYFADLGKDDILKAIQANGWSGTLGLVVLLVSSFALAIIYKRYGLAGGGVIISCLGIGFYYWIWIFR